MKNSISKKIRRQMLFGSAAAALSVCIAATLCILIMRGSMIGTSEQLGSSAAGDSKAALEAQMEESLFQLARNKASISDEKLAAVTKLVTVIAENATLASSNPMNYLPQSVEFPNAANAGRTVAQLRLADESAYAMLEDEIGLLGNLSGLLISQHDALDYVASVYLGSESGVSLSADGDSEKKVNTYDPRTRGWYSAARDAGALTWTDVFVDNSGRGLGITCAMPYYGADGKMRGVAGAGMLLAVLNEIVVETKLGETGYAFIVNERGDMIISDTVTIDADNNVVSRNVSDLFPRETAERIQNGGGGIERAGVGGDDFFVAYAPLDTLPWNLVVVMSVEEVIAPALVSEEHIIGMTRDAARGIDRMILIAIAVFAAALVLTLAGNAVLARGLAAGLAKPIIELSDGAGIIGAGDLNHRLDVKTGDELEALAVAFNFMIDGIKLVTAEKERIGAELDVATRIQAGMLPCIFPPFPDRNEFDIYASMLPAKEVGGDFYDFFLVGDDTLAVVMADVSGKGIPAALFMVIAKTLIKNNAQSGKSPAAVFETVNDMLCENNDVGMFVTAFMGYVDLASGKLTYVNAGHNPPLIKKSGGSYEWLSAKPGFILAGMEEMAYTQSEITLNPGDKLFLYTDGVTEAFNNEDELFGDPRLLETANKYGDCPVKELLLSVKREIDLFADGAEQSDDITMLALQMRDIT